MNLPDRHLLLGMFLGAVCATALAATGPGMVLPALAADDVAEPAFNPANLVKFEDKTYDVKHENWVATDPLSNARVKKIEGGRVSYVGITTTATGTYSSDAMFSPHVQYPGISAKRVRSKGQLRFWSGGGWHGFEAAVADSFFYFNSGATQVLGDIVCVAGENFAVC